MMFDSPHSMLRPRVGTLVFVLALTATTTRSAAQESPVVDPVRSLATRAELQSERDSLQRSLGAAPSSDRKHIESELAVINRRLSAGDFRVGDLIAVFVAGDPNISDTLVVQPGPMVRFQGLTNVPLAGVLRSEVRARLTESLAKYIKNPDVRAVSLIRIGVSGEVGRPGFYSIPFESVLSDVMMIAGGGTGTTDLRRITIRRGDQTTWGAEDVQRAIASGLTLDQMDLAAGDEIVVGSRRQTNWGLWLGFVGTLLGVATLLTTARR